LEQDKEVVEDWLMKRWVGWPTGEYD